MTLGKWNKEKPILNIEQPERSGEWWNIGYFRADIREGLYERCIFKQKCEFHAYKVHYEEKNSKEGRHQMPTC